MNPETRIVVTTIAMVVCLLVAGFRASLDGLTPKQRSVAQLGRWVAKPLASTGFVVLAVQMDAMASAYGKTVLLALCLCWLGDALLLPDGKKRIFLAGLGAFLAGHVVFALAFVPLNTAPMWTIGGLLGAAAFAVTAGRWLLPNVSDKMRVPVIAYILAIGTMMGLSVGAVGAGHSPAGAIGAIGFALSDLAVARNRFIAPGFFNRLWGQPLYYAAQLILAATVAPGPGAGW